MANITGTRRSLKLTQAYTHSTDTQTCKHSDHLFDETVEQRCDSQLTPASTWHVRNISKLQLCSALTPRFLICRAQWLASGVGEPGAGDVDPGPEVPAFDQELGCLPPVQHHRDHRRAAQDHPPVHRLLPGRHLLNHHRLNARPEHPATCHVHDYLALPIL